MATQEITLNEIRQRGFAVLARELGPVGYVRFLQQFALGSGNYTMERQQWVDSLGVEKLQSLLTRESKDAGA